MRRSILAWRRRHARRAAARKHARGWRTLGAGGAEKVAIIEKYNSLGRSRGGQLYNE